MRILATALAALCMFGAPDAFAQKAPATDGPTQVRGYLTSEATKHTAEGFRPDPANPDFIRDLAMDKAVIWPINLRRGVTYRVMAVCDNHCTDVDMDLYDQTGAFVGTDVSTTDKPYVEITPDADGVAYARIWLAVCEADACTIGGRVYRKGG